MANWRRCSSSELTQMEKGVGSIPMGAGVDGELDGEVRGGGGTPSCSEKIVGCVLCEVAGSGALDCWLRLGKKNKGGSGRCARELGGGWAGFRAAGTAHLAGFEDGRRRIV